MDENKSALVHPGLPPDVEELYRGFDRVLVLGKGLHQSKDEIRRALVQANVGTGIPDNKKFEHIVAWGKAQGHTITTTKPSTVGGTRVPHLLGARLREIPVPQWMDEDAVTKLVEKELDDAESNAEYKFAMLPWDTHPGISGNELLHGMERDAVAAAERGDIGPLADLLRPEHPLNEHPLFGGNPIRSHFSAMTWTLVADFLTGERNPRTGRLKGKPGRSKMTAEERRAMNPVHDAADMVPVIADILLLHYPEQTPAQIRDRALSIAAGMKGVKSAETVNFHLNRAKNDRRRI
jgi:hypothetical protein